MRSKIDLSIKAENQNISWSRSGCEEPSKLDSAKNWSGLEAGTHSLLKRHPPKHKTTPTGNAPRQQSPRKRPLTGMGWRLLRVASDRRECCGGGSKQNSDYSDLLLASQRFGCMLYMSVVSATANERIEPE